MLVFDKYLCSFLVFSHLVIADLFFFFFLFKEKKYFNLFLEQMERERNYLPSAQFLLSFVLLDLV